MHRSSLFVIIALVLSFCCVHPVHGQQSSFLRTQTSSAVNITNKRVNSTQTETRELGFFPKFRPGAAGAAKGVIGAHNNGNANEEPPLWSKILAGFVMAGAFVSVIWCCTRCVRKCTELDQPAAKAIAPVEVSDEEKSTPTDFMTTKKIRETSDHSTVSQQTARTILASSVEDRC